ncbi:MAG: hypothetical protein DRO89_00405 [Candidatus Altiarchaeales archaeon]|nr:MAG: hypothetical protein DRO89_00405 [Candidatus Altiarchaeales archaeon]
MHFIREIFRGNQDREYIHRKFVRYGRGEFEGPVIRIRNSGNRLKINASDDYVNILGEILAKNSSKALNVSGNIISRDNIESLLSELGIPIEKATGKKGLFTLNLKGTIPAENLSRLYSELKGSHIFLDLTSSDKNSHLKTKKRLPRLGSEPDQNFCSAIFDTSLTDAIMNEICFDIDVKDFEEIKISHRYIIKELLIPEEYRENLALARIYSKRKGIIKRFVEIDGRKTEIEHEFIV